MVDNKFIKQARSADLANYLLGIGEPLIQSGSRYKHKDHDSLVFTKNSYYWNSRQEHGNSVDYLIRHKNMSFSEAVEALTTFMPAEIIQRKEPKELKISPNYERAIAYLNKTRGISYEVIRNLIDSKHLYQEQNTNNIIFPIYDEKERYVGAELAGSLSDKRFKGVQGNSKYGYGYNIGYSENDSYDYILFFESAIDLVSFIDLKINFCRKNLKRCLLVSMSGLKLNIVTCSLKAFKGSLDVFICVDNDEAGTKFKYALEGLKITFKEYSPDLRFKDWNDQLKEKRNKEL